MEQKTYANSSFQTIPKSALAFINGGGKEEEEYRIIYINGIPYRIRINKNGAAISPPEEII